MGGSLVAEAEAAAEAAGRNLPGFRGILESQRRYAMGVYEFEGQLYETEGEFLDALAHEYRTGDKELVIDTLENFGYSVSDINVRPGKE